MNRRLTATLLAAPLLFLAPDLARPSPVHYDFQMTVTSPAAFFSPGHCSGEFFPCDAGPGTTFRGHFTIDDGALANNGVGGGHMTNFWAQVGNVVWAQNHPSSAFLDPLRSFFLAFRDSESFALSPDVAALDGELTGLRGGVVGRDDYPYIDFFLGSADFGMSDGNVQLRGAMTFFRAAEPGGLALAALASALALLSVGLAGRRGKQNEV